MATLKDIAYLANVSPATVSIVLSGRGDERKITKETQDRIFQIAKDIRYRPSLTARKLRYQQRRDYTIGVFWNADIRMDSLTRILNGFRQVQESSGMLLNPVIRPFHNGHLDQDKTLKDNYTYDAVMLSSTTAEDIAYLEKNPPQIPVLLVNRYSDYFHSASIDDTEIGVLAAEELLRKAPVRVGAIFSRKPFMATKRRCEVFLETCAQKGYTIAPENIFYPIEDSFHGGATAALQMLEQGNLPDALFCMEDQTAWGALNIFQRNLVNVPDNMRMLAVGNNLSQVCEYNYPSITTVDVPYEEIGKQSAKLLLKIVQHETDRIERIVLQPALKVRDSTR